MGYRINRKELPPLFPTNRHQPDFWEALGQTIAIFGFLELFLAQAIFALTGTRRFSNEKECADRFEVWIKTLEHALYDTLRKLADSYGAAAKAHPNFTLENVEGLVSNIKKFAELRNVLAHGSWPSPNEAGQSTPFFVNRQKEVLAVQLMLLGFCRSKKKLQTWPML